MKEVIFVVKFKVWLIVCGSFYLLRSNGSARSSNKVWSYGGNRLEYLDWCDSISMVKFSFKNHNI